MNLKELKTEIQANTCPCSFIAAHFPTGKRQKYLRCPSTDERINKLWYILTMEYHSAEEMAHWHTLQCGWTSKASRWVEKLDTKGHMVYDLIYMKVQNEQIHTDRKQIRTDRKQIRRDRKQIGSCQRVKVQGYEEWLLMGMGFPLGVMKKFWN